MEFKQGDSFLFVGTVKVNDVAQDLTGWSLDADICAAPGSVVGAKIADLPVTVLDAPAGQIQLGSNASTAAWPLGRAVVDIKATTPGGTIIRSNTARVVIVEAVTT